MQVFFFTFSFQKCRGGYTVIKFCSFLCRGKDGLPSQGASDQSRQKQVQHSEISFCREICILCWVVFGFCPPLFTLHTRFFLLWLCLAVILGFYGLGCFCQDCRSFFLASCFFGFAANVCFTLLVSVFIGELCIMCIDICL